MKAGDGVGKESTRTSDVIVDIQDLPSERGGNPIP